MAYYAKLTEQNEVLTNIVFDEENEELGIQKLSQIFNWPIWKKSNQKLSPRWTWNTEHNRFIPPKPFDSWVLNTQTFTYEAPVAKPDDGQNYKWNEETLTWVAI
jgi:hypothetical protein